MGTFLNSIVGVAIVTIASTALVTIATGVIKMMVDLARLTQTVSDIKTSLDEFKGNTDMMRWSEYGRREYDRVRKDIRSRGTR